MKSDPSAKQLLHSIYLTTSLWIFALGVNAPFPLKGIAFIGLLASAHLISLIHKQNRKVCWHISQWPLNRSVAWLILISLTLSAMLAVYYRHSISMPAVPVSVRGFVIISILIGCVEEIVFRGFVQGEASRWNAQGAIVIGAISHAGYKALLFVLSEQAIDTSPQRLFVGTALAGLVLGFTRYRSGSLWPCLLAHGLFDFWVYAEQSSAPWWVW